MNAIMDQFRSIQLSHLMKYDLIYVGSPYSKYERGIEAAFRDVSAVMGELVISGLKVYSPIAHTHSIAVHGGLDPLDHNLWLPFDQTMMDKSDAMLIVKLPGWRASYGIKHEIMEFTKAGKPIFEIHPVTFEVTEWRGL